MVETSYARFIYLVNDPCKVSTNLHNGESQIFKIRTKFSYSLKIGE